METIQIYFKKEGKEIIGTAERISVEVNRAYYIVTAPGIDISIEPLYDEEVGIKWVDYNTQKETDLTYLLGNAIESAEM